MMDSTTCGVSAEGNVQLLSFDNVMLSDTSIIQIILSLRRETHGLSDEVRHTMCVRRKAGTYGYVILKFKAFNQSRAK